MSISIFQLSLTRSLQLYQLLRVGAAVLTGVLLAKTDLATADLGTWEALLFIGTVVLFTGVNGLLQAITPSYSPLSEPEKPVFLQEVVAVFLLLGLLFFGVFITLESKLVPLFTGLPSLPGFRWYALFLLLQLPTLPTEHIFLLKEKPRSIIWWGIWGFGAQLLAVIIPAGLGWGLQSMLQMLCLQAAAKLLFTFGLLDAVQFARFQRGRILRYLSLSWPMVAASFTGNLIVFFDTWLVAQWFSDLSTFAIYRYGSRELPIALALATALGTSMVPLLAVNIEAGLLELKKRSTRMIHTVLPISILLLVSVQWWFPLVFNQALAPAAPLFAIYLLLSLSRVLLPNSILLGLSDTRIIWLVSLAELAVKIITGWVFIQWWGLTGIAWSAIISFWFEKIALSYWLWKQHAISPGKWLDWKTYGCYTCLMLLAWIVMNCR